MKSDAPKVLTPIGGVPILLRLLKTVQTICPHPTVVVGYGAELVRAAVGDGAECVFQEEQLGTGHAVLSARQALSGRADIDNIVVLNGDHPLLGAETIRGLIRAHEGAKPAITLATVKVSGFFADFAVFERFGRIIRDVKGGIVGIREWKDATPEERALSEVNPNYYCFTASWLWGALDQLTKTNQAGEYYLTDLVQIAIKGGDKVQTVPVLDPIEGMGVNTPEELAIVERYI